MTLEWKIIYTVLAVCAVLAVILFSRQPIHDWVTVFTLKSVITTFIDPIVVGAGMLEYPVRLLPQFFQFSLLFNYLVYPLVCVMFNQTTYNRSLKNILAQAVFYSAVITLMEVWLEKHTQLIEFHTWTWYYSFISLTLVTLLIRGLMALFRQVTRHSVSQSRRA